ncbi:glycerol-3-phosphate transporter ATP-binding subunit [Cupriavidus basilensis OR16]|uniref:Glycerol-3-phosphate transporter ATP-binding subunit n=1 Tax=Cupriavidus basilensis OR16 TaxID=1127483 RepID=H1SH28_9BURK|nr:ATP-binding cassette domain-containing protein [Cupriavidus basilensis]EHP38175.1 glycerol-3-phosphate transporter ATP-binding subunit [Cupriavidus basilensis OR16]
MTATLQDRGPDALANTDVGGPAQPLVIARDLVKHFPLKSKLPWRSGGEVRAVDGVSFEVRKGETLGVVGESGCGKSTTARLLMQLIEQNSGELIFDALGVGSAQLPMKRYRSQVQMVFQDSYSSLNPRLTIEESIAFTARVHGIDAAEASARSRALLDRVGLEPTRFAGRYPHELSGGQRQRVAMGRAIVREPAVFLFDEPLSNLDAKLRVQMRLELKELHRRLRTTSMYVTHDQVEAMTLADRMMVLNGGRVEQIGTPLEVYARPASTFVASFIGSPPMNLIPVARTNGGQGEAQMRVEQKAGAQGAAATLGHLPMGLHLPERALLGLRPEHIEPCAAHVAIAEIEIRLVEALGADSYAYGTLGGQPVVVRLDSNMPVRGGDRLPITATAEHLHFFDADTGKRIDA